MTFIIIALVLLLGLVAGLFIKISSIDNTQKVKRIEKILGIRFNY